MGTDIQLTPTAGMPPITTVTGSSGTFSGNEQIVQSPAAAAALTAAQQAGQNVSNAENAVVPAIGQTIEGKAAGTDLLQQQQLADNAERSQLIASKQPAISAAEKQAKEAESRFENHQFYDYLSQRSSGDKIMSKIALALNAGANAYLGIAGNELADDLKHKVDMDFDKQKIQLHSKENIAKWKKEGVKDLYDKLQLELGALDVKQAKAYEAVKLKSESLALRAGIPEAQAKQNVVTAKMDEATAAKKLEAAQRYEKHASSKRDVSNSTSTTAAKAGGGGVEADKNAANFDVLKEHGDWMARAMPGLSESDVAAINRVVGAETFRENWPGVSAALTQVGIDPEKGASSQAKEYINRLHSYEEGLGRLQSGGAIGAKEGMRFQDSARPRVTDTKEERVNRAKILTTDIGLRGAHVARPGRTTVEPAANPPAGKLLTVKSGPYAGKTVRDLGGGKYELVE